MDDQNRGNQLNFTRLTRGARPALGQVFRACSAHALDSPSAIPPPSDSMVDATMLLLQLMLPKFRPHRML